MGLDCVCPVCLFVTDCLCLMLVVLGGCVFVGVCFGDWCFRFLGLGLVVLVLGWGWMVWVGCLGLCFELLVVFGLGLVFILFLDFVLGGFPLGFGLGWGWCYGGFWGCLFCIYWWLCSLGLCLGLILGLCWWLCALGLCLGGVGVCVFWGLLGLCFGLAGFEVFGFCVF